MNMYDEAKHSTPEAVQSSPLQPDGKGLRRLRRLRGLRGVRGV